MIRLGFTGVEEGGRGRDEEWEETKEVRDGVWDR